MRPMILLILFLLFTACQTKTDAKVTSTDTSAVDATSADVTVDTSTAVNSAVAIEVIDVEAFQFGFEPVEIKVKQGEKVTIRLSTRDVAHSMLIENYDVMIRTSPGAPGEETFVADKAGIFSFRCRTPCGSGHSSMSGTLIVE